MPELPWVKWFPTNWLSEAGLSMCDAATRGIWADAVNSMMNSGTYFLEGSMEQLSRVCRCREQQMEVACVELKQFRVADISDAEGMHRIECRRLRREMEIKDLKRKAANTRWCKDDAHPHAPGDANTHAPSAYAYASASKEGKGVGGETNGVCLPPGFPGTVDDAILKSGSVGCPVVFVTDVWNKAMSRGGRDAKDVEIRSWSHYVSREWSYEQSRKEEVKSRNGHAQHQSGGNL